MINTNNATLQITAGLLSQFPKDNLPQVAFSGRSNVGKSSLINTLLNRKSLARVSGEPGKTITINYYNIDRSLYLVDLPGYGYAKRTPEEKARWSELTDSFFTRNPSPDSLKLVIQLVDSRIGMTSEDAEMLNFMTVSHIPFIVVATKADKLNATERKISEDAIRNHRTTRAAKEIIFSSAKNKTGKEEIWKQIYASIK